MKLVLVLSRPVVGPRVAPHAGAWIETILVDTF